MPVGIVIASGQVVADRPTHSLGEVHRFMQYKIIITLRKV